MNDVDGTRGSGERLRPFRRWQVLHRMLYTVDLPAEDGAAVRYTVDFNSGGEDWAAELYANGRKVAKKDLPAKFHVAGGVIEVGASLYGVTRVHFVPRAGDERRLTPVPGTLEDLRGRLGRRHPRLSRAIGWAAIAVLAVNLVVAVPYGLEVLTEIPKIAERFGTFTSPIQLPVWLDIALLCAGVLAGIERVLTYRHNKILDFETLWTSL
jgi:hypothetical protein